MVKLQIYPRCGAQYVSSEATSLAWSLVWEACAALRYSPHRFTKKHVKNTFLFAPFGSQTLCGVCAVRNGLPRRTLGRPKIVCEHDS